MESLQHEHDRLTKSNLAKSIDDVQQTIDLLTKARDTIAKTNNTQITLAKLQNPVKQSFDKLNTDLKGVYSALGKYQKALDRKFKTTPFPTEYDALSSHPRHVNRAIATHLLREGQFSVASTFLKEISSTPSSLDHADGHLDAGQLQQSFAEMYDILHNMQTNHDLADAIRWAESQRPFLDQRGSNLEFELCRLQFLWLLMGRPGGDVSDGSQRALRYARREFPKFAKKYTPEIESLSGAIAYLPNLRGSPYGYMLKPSMWDEVANSFTREFCSHLGLSADSQLYIAATAGAIALPTLMKYASIVKEKRTEWTTDNELPVEIPLPPAFRFHSVFVCPVSKEQTTEDNPPMMLPCGHAIAKESLDRISKGGRFKCPYCPTESLTGQARRIYL